MTNLLNEIDIKILGIKIGKILSDDLPSDLNKRFKKQIIESNNKKGLEIARELNKSFSEKINKKLELFENQIIFLINSNSDNGGNK